jgi:uncharacterized membrane protein YhiD involved in acid resistance
MPEFLRGTWTDSSPSSVFVRLVAAMALGAVVAVIYRGTRPNGEAQPSFPVTLVLLSILIAMVTQVIGDNVARAFSLVGALSIVRFRTVVRDTQDTAFVIFAVAVGMAVGAGHPMVALSGIAVVGAAAWIMSRRGGLAPSDDLYTLEVKVGVGQDAEAVLRPALDTFVKGRRVISLSTAKQGMAIEVRYQVALVRQDAAGELVRTLNKIEGVQGVSLQRIVPPAE